MWRLSVFVFCCAVFSAIIAWLVNEAGDPFTVSKISEIRRVRRQCPYSLLQAYLKGNLAWNTTVLAPGTTYAVDSEFDLAIDKVIEHRACHPAIYCIRGDIHAAREEYEEAIFDYGKIIEVSPKDIAAYLSRGNAHLALGENESAIADATRALELGPEGRSGAKTLDVRGNMRFVMGDFADASSDAARAIELTGDTFAMITRYLAQSRHGDAGAEKELAADASRLKTKDWPYPLIELFLGVRTPAAALEATTKPEERCEMQFYIGEWHILKGQRADAEAVLKTAIKTCPGPHPTRIYARAELKRL
jgi:tetratricopeptide (TPR) repeat protein